MLPSPRSERKEERSVVVEHAYSSERFMPAHDSSRPSDTAAGIFRVGLLDDGAPLRSLTPRAFIRKRHLLAARAVWFLHQYPCEASRTSPARSEAEGVGEALARSASGWGPLQCLFRR